MTIIYQNYDAAAWGQSGDGLCMVHAPRRDVVTVTTGESFVPATVGKVLAAKQGRNARAPKGKQEFLDWLNCD